MNICCQANYHDVGSNIRTAFKVSGFLVTSKMGSCSMIEECGWKAMYIIEKETRLYLH